MTHVLDFRVSYRRCVVKLLTPDAGLASAEPIFALADKKKKGEVTVSGVELVRTESRAVYVNRWYTRLGGESAIVRHTERRIVD